MKFFLLPQKVFGESGNGFSPRAGIPGHFGQTSDILRDFPHEPPADEVHPISLPEPLAPHRNHELRHLLDGVLEMLLHLGKRLRRIDQHVGDLALVPVAVALVFGDKSGNTYVYI